MSETVTIGGREFRIGATYAPKPLPPGLSHKLVGNRHQRSVTKDGSAFYVKAGGSGTGIMSGDMWAAWAGDEVQP